MRKLSELHTGESGVIVRVNGQGAFRKRIIEMGFIKGKTVNVLQEAPLKDPVKYQIMSYEVSLRHSDSSMIDVISMEEAKQLKKKQPDIFTERWEDELNLMLEAKEKATQHYAQKRINIALVGNPNSGKTSLFNFVSGAHEHVGNYAGVTVDAKEGHAFVEGYDIKIVDLPGTYSLSPYSPEELYVRKELIDHRPDIILNVIDTTNIERNLYLTTQLIDLHIPFVCALNMYDEAKSRGDHLDIDKLGELFGTEFIPTVFKNGDGVKELFHQIIETFENIGEYRYLHINYGHEIEHGISKIQHHLAGSSQLDSKYTTRYLGIKLLENDQQVTNYIQTLPESRQIFEERDKAIARVFEETKEESETIVMDAKYAFVYGALKEADYRVGHKTDIYQLTHRIDKMVTNKYLGFPVFLLMIWLMFEVTFRIGQYPMDWIDMGVARIGDLLSTTMAEGPLKSLLIQGIVGGVGAVIVFLPQIIILYFFISLMEDSGYMARASFIMDKLMHKIGLHGKSFIPLIMGFGCNVPAIMATRTIESPKSRIVTMLILPFMSCSARLPIYIMIIGTFFSTQYRSHIMISLYLIGMIVAIICAKVLGKFIVRGKNTPFVMELPPYRFPTAKALGRHTWDKGKQYLKKMGTVILVASIIVWALGYFPHHDELPQQEQMEQSYLGKIGKTISPVFTPQGFNWKLDMAILAGVGAKEIVASTIGVLYSDDDSFGDDDRYDTDSGKYALLHQQMASEGITPVIAYAFLLFVLLYFPCVATVAAIYNETGGWKWAIFMATYTTGIAWIVSALFRQIASLFV